MKHQSIFQIYEYSYLPVAFYATKRCKSVKYNDFFFSVAQRQFLEPEQENKKSNICSKCGIEVFADEIVLYKMQKVLCINCNKKTRWSETKCLKG
jgi:formylmethanofuran dehydrogenase subunit E